MIKEIQLAWVAILILSFNNLSPAQGWKSYPYHPDGTLIYFPRDEGSHPEFKPGSGTEWWYVNLHLQGDSSHHDYSAMVAYFNYNFRIFNITDETDQDFHSFTNIGLLSVSEEYLGLKFYPLLLDTEQWVTKRDSLGALLPFQYHLKVGGENYSLDLDLDAQKRPLIIGRDGLVTVGSGDSYYYSLTQLLVTGRLKFKEKTEAVSGIAWIDHQYGPFFVSPGGEESYEWFSLQLDNGMDINLWNIFTGENKIPQDDSHRIFTMYIDDQTQDTSSTFSLQRLSFWEYSEQLYFSSGWHLMEPIHNIDLVITPLFQDQVVGFGESIFWEGSCRVAGKIHEKSVGGHAFAELLHLYATPQITVISPNGGEQWDGSQPVVWRLDNPDDGNPLQYDLYFKTEGDSQYFPIAAGLIDTMFYWDVSNLAPRDSIRIKVVGYSIDSSIIGADISDGIFPIVPATAIKNWDNQELNSFQLFQNYPNPFNTVTAISYQLSAFSEVDLAIYDMLGRKIKTLVHENQQRGNYEIRFDAAELASGMYFYKLKAGNFQQIKKMILIK